MAEAGADLAIASRKLPDLEKVAEWVRRIQKDFAPRQLVPRPEPPREAGPTRDPDRPE